MKEVIRMWQQTKLVVLVAIAAGLYAALLIPFKLFQIIPGITEIRPASCIPIICSLFFGPAAAWGSAIGNLIGDFAGQFGPGSIPGFIGNFVYAFLPYRIWKKYKKTISKEVKNLNDIFFLIFIIFVSSSACSSIISWGLQLIGLPFASLAGIIFLNNFISGIILVPILCNWFDKRIYAWHLNYEELLNEKEFSSQKFTSFFLSILLILLFLSFFIGHIPVFFKLTGYFKDYADLSYNPIIAFSFIILILIISLLI